MADVIVINKVDTATPENVEIVKQNIRSVNPDAVVIEAASPITPDDSVQIRGKKVLAIEDGPTLTHGGMEYGAAYIAAQRFGAAEIVSAVNHAVGSIKHTSRAAAAGQGPTAGHDAQPTPRPPALGGLPPRRPRTSGTTRKATRTATMVAAMMIDSRQRSTAVPVLHHAHGA